MDERISEHDKALNLITEQLLHAEVEKRKLNIKILGLEEDRGEDSRRTAIKVRDMFRLNLKLQYVDEIRFERVHRIGRASEISQGSNSPFDVLG